MKIVTKDYRDIKCKFVEFLSQDELPAIELEDLKKYETISDNEIIVKVHNYDDSYQYETSSNINYIKND